MQEVHLKEGQILFIRDFDLHDYKSADGNYFEFINLAFTKENLDNLFFYLGDGFPSSTLLSAELPPIATLSPAKKESLFFALTDLTQNTDNAVASTKMRTLLCEIFTKYFFNFSEKKSEIPFWLETTCEKMKKPQNFISGAQKMYEISGRTREHVCRSMKKYYGTTVSEFVTDLRLEYCASLLISSNLLYNSIYYLSLFNVEYK